MEVEQYKHVMKKLNHLLKKTRIRAREIRRKSFPEDLSEALEIKKDRNHVQKKKGGQKYEKFD